MDIEYKTRAIKRICTDAAEARRKRGLEMAKKISQRIDEIRSVDSVETMLKYLLAGVMFFMEIEKDYMRLI